jgi:hypothetical protein
LDLDYAMPSALRMGDKYHNYNKIDSTGRNETYRFNPITPNTEIIHDINRYKSILITRPITRIKLIVSQFLILGCAI